MGEIPGRNGDEGVIEVASAGQEIVGETALRADEGDAGGEVRAREAAEAGGVEKDGGAVGARAGRRHAGASHGAGVLLVDAEALRGGERWDSGEQQQRKPPHT